MELLYTKAVKAGIPVPEVREESLDTSKLEEAFLPRDEVETLYMSWVYVTLHFFLQRGAFVDILNKLEKYTMDVVEREDIPSYNFRTMWYVEEKLPQLVNH